MLQISRHLTIGFLVAGACVGLAPLAAHGEDKPLRTDVPLALAQRMATEGQGREACKKSICDAERSKQADGAPLTCKVVKTWAAKDLSEKILKGKMDWKWGNAQCETTVSLDRAVVAKIASETKFEAKIGKHQVSCNLEKEDGTETNKLTFTIDPTVTFENGKAVKAVLGWSEVNGSAVVKSALWSATAIDNTFNVLQGAVIGQINEFFGPKCDEAMK